MSAESTALAFGFMRPVIVWRHAHFYLADDETAPRFHPVQENGDGWSTEKCDCGFLSWRSWEPEPEWGGSDL